MTLLDYVGLIAAATPGWAYALLALLIVLGVRRLKSRVRRMGLVFTVPVAFFGWGLVNVAAYGQAHSGVVGWSLLAIMLAVGGVSARLFSTEHAERLRDGRLLLHGTPEPLITYLMVFAARFGLEVWMGFEPGISALAGGLAIALSAFVAGRTAQRAYGLYRLRGRDILVA